MNGSLKLSNPSDSGSTKRLSTIRSTTNDHIHRGKNWSAVNQRCISDGTFGSITSSSSHAGQKQNARKYCESGTRRKPPKRSNHAPVDTPANWALNSPNAESSTIATVGDLA